MSFACNCIKATGILWHLTERGVCKDSKYMYIPPMKIVCRNAGIWPSETE